MEMAFQNKSKIKKEEWKQNSPAKIKKEDGK